MITAIGIAALCIAVLLFFVMDALISYQPDLSPPWMRVYALGVLVLGLLTVTLGASGLIFVVTSL